MACHAEQITADIGSNPTALEERFQDMTGNTKVWRAPLAGLASVAMIATMGVAASTANAAAANTDPTFTVKLDANGRGKFSVSDIKVSAVADSSNNVQGTYHTGALPTIPTDVSSDWTFTGWYTSAKLGEGERFNTQAPVLGDVTLYAHWAKTTDVKTVEVADNASVDLSYADTNQDGNTDGTDYSFEVAPGDKLSAWMAPSDNNPADGHKLTGFEDADGKAFDFTQAVTDDVDITATAKDSRAFIVKGANLSGYKYNYDADGDHTNDSTALEVVNGQTPKLPTAIDPSNSKIVSKWINEGDGQTWKPGPLKTADGNYHNWTVVLDSSSESKDAYSVNFTYDSGASNLVGDSAPATRYVEAGKTLGSLPEPNLYDGKLVFDGWNNGAARYYGDEPVTSDLNLNGTFSIGVVQYTVTFDPNYTGSTPTDVKTSDGATVAKPADPTRDGFVFAGWATNGFTAADFSGSAAAAAAANVKVYKTDADFRSFTVLKGLTFKALWLTASQAELQGLLDETGAAYDKDTQAWTDFANKRNDIAGKASYATDAATPTVAQVNGLSHVSEAAAKDYIKQLSDLKAKLVTSSTNFSDVFDGNYNSIPATPHYEEIAFVAKKGISTGYGDGTFKPTGSMYRQDYAAFLYRLAGSPEYTPAASDNIFTDVTPATPHYKEILWAAKQGIIKGFADGTFRGLALVNRQDAAAFLYRLAGSPEYDPSTAAKTFTDVNESTPHYKEVLWAANTVVNYDYDGVKGSTAIINGFQTGTFDGYATLLRQDGAAFLARTYFYINK